MKRRSTCLSLSIIGATFALATPSPALATPSPALATPSPALAAAQADPVPASPPVERAPVAPEPPEPAPAPQPADPTPLVEPVKQAPRAETANINDGVYGRFDGDLDLSLAAGSTFGSGGPTGAAIARAIFMQTAGVYVSYNDALGRTDAPLTRSLALGVTLRPFFIPRWSFDLEYGPAILDLTIDAFAFDLGVLWPANRDGSFVERPGMEAALGTEVPLFGKASGPFLGARGALRWRGSELASHDDNGLEPILFLTLAWHTIIDGNIVDAGDRRLR